MMLAPQAKPCKECNSKECGPYRCRFHDDPPREVERDDRLDELREYDRHPERYR